MKGSGPLYDELHARFEAAVEPRPAASLPRAAPGAPARARRAAPADRQHELRPRARAGVRGGGRGARHRRLRRGRAAPRTLLAPAAGRAAAADRRPEHVRDRALARAPDDPAQAARRRRPAPRAGVGELRHHRGRLHRLPRSLRADRGRPRRARREAAAKPLPLPRLRDGRLEPPPDPQPHLGRAAGGVPLVGRAALAEPARAGVLAAVRRHARSTSSPRRTSSCSSGGWRPRDGATRRRRRTRASTRSRTPSSTRCSSSAASARREIVAANLIASRLTVLYGPSGVGKSSLLRAAVARSLRDAPGGAARRRLLALERRPGARRWPKRWRRPPGRRRTARRSRRSSARSRTATSTSSSTRRRSTSSTTPTTAAPGRSPRRSRRSLGAPLPGQRARLAARGLAREARSLHGPHPRPLREHAPPRPARPRRPRARRSSARRALSRSSPATRSRVEPELVERVLDEVGAGQIEPAARRPRRRRGSDADGAGSRRRTSSSSCSGSGTRSAQRARRRSAPRRSSGSAARSTSSRSTSRARWTS